MTHRSLWVLPSCHSNQKDSHGLVLGCTVAAEVVNWQSMVDSSQHTFWWAHEFWIFLYIYCLHLQLGVFYLKLGFLTLEKSTSLDTQGFISACQWLPRVEDWLLFRERSFVYITNLCQALAYLLGPWGFEFANPTLCVAQIIHAFAILCSSGVILLFLCPLLRVSSSLYLMWLNHIPFCFYCWMEQTAHFGKMPGLWPISVQSYLLHWSEWI